MNSPRRPRAGASPAALRATQNRVAAISHVCYKAIVATVVCGDFEWDDRKAAANVLKHGVSFEEAATAVVDERALFLADDSAPPEQRYGVIGMSLRARMLLVVIVERGDRDRIISARPATKSEEKIYGEGS